MEYLRWQDFISLGRVAEPEDHALFRLNTVEKAIEQPNPTNSMQRPADLAIEAYGQS